MVEDYEWEIATGAQPDGAGLAYDLDHALASVVSVKTRIPEDAFTAGILGTERAGSGVVIRDGIILTIGYLITEAEAVWIVSGDGAATPAHVVGYDHETGFGVVQALGRIDAPVIEFGDSDLTAVGDRVIVAAYGGRRHALKARIADKREFAGSWEYVLDEAIFTTPAHPDWGGDALIGGDGLLAGIGSLYIQQSGGPGEVAEGNMFVPINLAKPIIEDMLRTGRPARPPRPWLGLYTTDSPDHVMVAGLARGGPSSRAGIRVGDEILEVDGAPVLDVASMFRSVWALGSAGVKVPLTLRRQGEGLSLTVRSGDRTELFKAPSLH
jgi:S1-C subfamily serine protease